MVGCKAAYMSNTGKSSTLWTPPGSEDSAPLKAKLRNRNSKDVFDEVTCMFGVTDDYPDMQVPEHVAAKYAGRLESVIKCLELLITVTHQTTEKKFVQTILRHLGSRHQLVKDRHVVPASYAAACIVVGPAGPDDTATSPSGNKTEWGNTGNEIAEYSQNGLDFFAPPDWALSPWDAPSAHPAEGSATDSSKMNFQYFESDIASVSEKVEKAVSNKWDQGSGDFPALGKQKLTKKEKKMTKKAIKMAKKARRQTLQEHVSHDAKDNQDLFAFRGVPEEVSLGYQSYDQGAQRHSHTFKESANKSSAPEGHSVQYRSPWDVAGSHKAESELAQASPLGRWEADPSEFCVQFPWCFSRFCICSSAQNAGNQPNTIKDGWGSVQEDHAGTDSASKPVPSAMKPCFVTYWATVECDGQKINIPIDGSNVTGPEKTVLKGGMKKVFKWVQEKGLCDKISLQDAFDLAMDINAGDDGTD